MLVLAITALSLLNVLQQTEPQPGISPQLKQMLDEPRLQVRLGAIPNVKLAPAAPRTPEEIARVRALIAKLAEVDSQDFGLSATLTGSAFAPIPAAAQASMILFAPQEHTPNPAFIELVELGQRALPELLDALDDPTSTKLKIRHPDPFLGGMWHSHEMGVNPAIDDEWAIVRPLCDKAWSLVDRRDADNPYSVTIGDVCFVAIGQITGRGYTAVRYQPTMCIIVNSPVHTRELADAVRRIWKVGDVRERLFQMLMKDFHTEGVFNGTSLDGWYTGSTLRCDSATRLLYYFPDQSSPLIARRLDELKPLGSNEALDDWMNNTVANKVRLDDFVTAVSWSENQIVRDALRRLEDRTPALNAPDAPPNSAPTQKAPLDK